MLFFPIIILTYAKTNCSDISFTFHYSFLFAGRRLYLSPTAVKKEMTAVQISNTIKVDGLLNEEEWKLAKPSPRFVQIEPQQGMPANFETEVKVLYNRQYLYVGFICHDSVG